MLDPAALIISLIFSLIGTGYFIYGKKQDLFWTMIIGIVLGIFPYFVSNVWGMVLVGMGLTVLPFLIGR